MSVIITSFREGDKILEALPDAIPFYVARRQPKGYFHHELPFLFARDIEEEPLRLKNYPDMHLARYKWAYLDYLTKNDFGVESWLQSLDNNVDILLCCWCPHSQSTRRQMKKFLTFACHTGIIGQMINHRRPDVQLWLDHDHASHLVKTWKPLHFRVIDS